MVKIVLEKEGTQGRIKYKINENKEFEIYNIYYPDGFTIEIKHKIK